MIYVGIPTLDEATLGPLLWRLRQVAARDRAAYTVLVCGDGDRNRLTDIVRRYSKLVPVEIVQPPARPGRAAALEQLIRSAVSRSDYPRRDGLLTMQADLTDSPDLISEMVRRFEGGVDLVTVPPGARIPGPKRGRLRRRLVRAALRRTARARGRLSDRNPGSSFRLYRLTLLERVIEAADTGPLMRHKGWAANVELLARTAPFVRRRHEIRLQGQHLHDYGRLRPSRFSARHELRCLASAARDGSLWRTARSTVARVAMVSAAAAAAALGAGATALPLAAQAPTNGLAGAESHTPPRDPDGFLLDLPFGVGETAQYTVTAGWGRARGRIGVASLAVEASERIRGTETLRLAMELSGRVLGFRLEQRTVSWLAPDPFRSLLFEEKVREPGFSRDRRTVIDHQSKTGIIYELDEETGAYAEVADPPRFTVMEGALDEISLLYLVRTLPLEVGQVHNLQRHFDEEDNPVIVEVLRRERVQVEAGTFQTIVVRPIIRSSSSFGEDNDSEVYLSDDDQRIIVQIRFNTRISQINMYLDEYSPGTGATQPPSL